MSKSQLAVITVLNVLIAGLLCVVFLFPNFRLVPTQGEGGKNDGTDTDLPTTITPHDKYRDAVDGKAPEILRETQLMGSGDETALGAYRLDGVTYIFGNATVGDYDFDRYGGFMCAVSDTGKIARYEYFVGRMTAVTLSGVGFVVATVSEAGTSKEKNYLYEVSGDTVIERAELQETAIDVLPVDDTRIAVVVKKSESCISLAEYVTGGDKWTKDRSTDVSSGYALDYIDCFIFGAEYIIAARASSLPRYDSVMFFVFAAGGDPTVHTYGGSGDSLLQPYGVMPYAGGYIVIARRGGTATVIGIDYAFKSYKRNLLDFSFDSAKLVYDGKNYYACFVTKTGTVTYAIDAALDTAERLNAFDGMTVDKAIETPPVFFAETSDKLIVADATGENKTTLDISGAAVYNCFFNGDGTKTAVLSATGGNAVGKPVGGRDIFVLTLK